ncbi:MAG: type II CAAX endopeptidase family protein [Candidatus Promineifilaceae bacterium]
MSSNELVIITLVMAGTITLANLLALRNKESEKLAFRLLLFVLNLPVLLIGLALLAAPADALQQLFQRSGQLIITGEGIKAMGPSILFMALWGMATSLKVFQRLLARLIPIEPGSPVHTLALVLTGYLIGNTALTLSQGGLEGLAETAVPTNLIFFAVSELLFAVVGILGVGLFIRRDWRKMMQRLGLVRPTARQLLGGVGWIVVLVLLEVAAAGLWSLLDPEQVANLDQINNALLGNVDTVYEWLVLALAAGIGEEILFRGAIQPRFGLWFTSIIFAILHVQYGFSPVTLFVVFLALILGHIRRRSNTTTAIFVHVGYDFTLGLFALLATYMQQFVP